MISKLFGSSARTQPTPASAPAPAPAPAPDATSKDSDAESLPQLLETVQSVAKSNMGKKRGAK